MIAANTSLTEHVLGEIADLERRVVEADGGRLKLGWSSLRSPGFEHVLVHDGDQLIGFLGVYRHGGLPELTGMVDPAHRGRGFGGTALARGLDLVQDAPQVLLVVPRASSGGRSLALRRGGVLEHSEHALLQRELHAVTDGPAGLTVRPAHERDRAVVDSLISAGFGFPRGANDSLATTLVADLDGRPVATLAVHRNGTRAGVYGFVVESDLRGRGLGGAVLGRVCRDLRADGIVEVELEVEVRNERALGLYTSLGFQPVTTEDYYRLPTTR